MSTILDIAASGRLEKYDPELPLRKQEERLVYFYPRVRDRIERYVSSLESQFENEITPEEQLYTVLEIFCAGEVLEFERQFHVLRQAEHGVWELKTRDLRLFGWFPKQDVFIWTNIEAKSRLLAVRGLVEGYRNEAQHDRDLLDLDEPKFVPGDLPHVVVSNFRYPPPSFGR